METFPLVIICVLIVSTVIFIAIHSDKEKKEEKETPPNPDKKEIVINKGFAKFIPISILVSFLIVFGINYWGDLSYSMRDYKNPSNYVDIKISDAMCTYFYETPFGNKIKIDGEYAYEDVMISPAKRRTELKLKSMINGTFADYKYILLFTVILIVIRCFLKTFYFKLR